MRRPLHDIPVGTRALILSKYYYGVLSRRLEELDIDRYYSILYFLSGNDGCCQQDICDSLAIDKSAMVKVMDHLITKGYVERRVNPVDRREHFILLTRKGRQQTKRVVSEFRKLDRQMFSGISATVKRGFIVLLDRLSSNLKTIPGNDLFFNYRKTRKTRSKREAL
jgi:MarR family transcriptional regulator, transcriptional regulator for hemolysin